jgi:hypothetical protein
MMTKEEKNRDLNKYGGGSGESHLYAVEARSTFGKPKVVSKDLILDNKWRRVPTYQATWGVPNNTLVPIDDLHLNLLSHRAALAIAHLFLAQLDADYFSATCVEVRLVEVKVKYSYSTEEMGVGEIINRSDGERARFSPRETEEIPLSARSSAVALPSPPQDDLASR